MEGIISSSFSEDTLVSGVREITTLSRLSHPNILRMFNLVLSQSSVLITLEECATDLAELVESPGSPLNEAQVRTKAIS